MDLIKYMDEQSKIRLNYWANKVAILSGVLWFCSLFFDALILYNNRVFSGIEILFIGWGGPLAGYFAWYANVFFLFAFYIQLSPNKISTKSSILAAILSLDVIRLQKYPQILGQDNGSQIIYGYGYGFIFWFTAIWLLCLSVGLKQLAKSNKDNSDSGKGNCCLSIIGLVFFYLFVLAKATTDRVYGNIEENTLFAKNVIAFKRGEICQTPHEVPKFQINAVNPIEIKVTGKRNLSPLNTPETFLKWGIPKVRMGNYDYFYTGEKDSYTLTAELKSGKSSGVLFVESNPNQIYMDLVDTNNNKAIFEQYWLRENKEFMCPRYRPYSKDNNLTKKLLTESISNLSPIEESELAHKRAKLTLANIISIKEETLNKEVIPNNQSCEPNIGFIDNSQFSESLAYISPISALSARKPAFELFNRYYFPNKSGKEFSKTLCKEKSIYLYGFTKNPTNLNVRLSKRNAETFTQDWKIELILKGPVSLINAETSFMLISQKTKNNAIIKIIDQDSKKVFIVDVDLQSVSL